VSTRSILTETFVFLKIMRMLGIKNHMRSERKNALPFILPHIVVSILNLTNSVKLQSSAAYAIQHYIKKSALNLEHHTSEGDGTKVYTFCMSHKDTIYLQK